MSGHVVSARCYVAVFLALLVLTLLTVGIAYIDLGVGNTVAAVSIATLKAVLVLLYFMHLRWSGHLIWVFFAGAVFWFAVLLLLTQSDYLTRGWLSN